MKGGGGGGAAAAFNLFFQQAAGHLKIRVRKSVWRKEGEIVLLVNPKDFDRLNVSAGMSQADFIQRLSKFAVITSTLVTVAGIAGGVHAAVRYGPEKAKKILLEKIEWPEDSTWSYVKETFELTQDIHKLVIGNEGGKLTAEKSNGGRKIGWVVVGKTTTTHRRWTPPAVADMTVIGAGSSFEILSI